MFASQALKIVAPERRRSSPNVKVFCDEAPHSQAVEEARDEDSIAATKRVIQRPRILRQTSACADKDAANDLQNESCETFVDPRIGVVVLLSLRSPTSVLTGNDNLLVLRKLAIADRLPLRFQHNPVCFE